MEMEFWERCVKARCVIIPVLAYSAYGDDGNLDEKKLIGVRFAALQFYDAAVGPDYWFIIDEEHAGVEYLHDTPEGALAAYEARKVEA